VLPDILAKNLSIVFVGTAAGRKSALSGCYYAGPGNRFWPTLKSVGFTEQLIRPEDFQSILSFGFGLTDLCKTQSGMDHAVSAWDVSGFRRKIQQASPKILALNGKKAAEILFGLNRTRDIAYGLQHLRVSELPPIFVLPSTSRASGKHWSIEPRRELHAWWKSNS